MVNNTSRSRSGMALVIVLCFLVLLTIVMLAFLSRSLSSGLISGASANATKADVYGKGAIDQVIGDLRQEIAAGSVVAGVNGAISSPSAVATNSAGYISYIYRPSSPATAVPYNSGPYVTTSQAWNNMPNLVKESARGQPFYATTAHATYNLTIPASSRAAPVSSTDDISVNGRFVSLARWNKHLLLPKASATITPSSSGTSIADTGTNAAPMASDPAATSPTANYFVSPDWIFTASDGSNPTTFSSTLTNPNANTYVVGRYSYAIYNEGGLLDANVAGFPTLYNQKGPASFADLTVLPGIASTTSITPQNVVNALVGWRNAATAQSTGTFPAYTVSTSGTTYTSYLQYILGINSRFMTVGSNNSQSDRAFTSRQQLIAFLQGVANGNASDEALLQDAMMYLGTFSRTLNQPSYWPDPTRPRVVGPIASNSSSYTGGNFAHGLDDTYNPPFKSIRVGTGWPGTRNDGTTWVVGDPLVKKRFALSRLMWLTYKGPSATLSSTDSLFQQYQNESMSAQAVTQLAAEGTAANIYKYFGLTWNAGPGTGGLGGYWVYNHGTGGSPESPASLRSLVAVQAAQREPDFFELLQATVNVGAIAKARIGPGVENTEGDYNTITDSYVMNAVLQLGANVIDEANPTQYPTHIEYDFGDVGYFRGVYGAMDLPGLHALMKFGFITQLAATNPLPAVPPALPQPTTGTFTSGGTDVILFVPVIWDAYDATGPTSAAVPPSTLVPSNLRITAVTIPMTTPTASAATTPWQFTPYYGIVVPTSTSTQIEDVASQVPILSQWNTEDATALTFSNETATTRPLYREPTALVRVTKPSNSNLALGPSNLIVSQFSSAGIPDLNYTGFAGLIGFLGGTYPECWQDTSTPPNIYTANYVEVNHPAAGMTVRLEYQVGSTWIPYQEVYTDGDNNALQVPSYESQTSSVAPCVLAPLGTSIWRSSITSTAATPSGTYTIPQAYGTYGWDPRDTRWMQVPINPGPQISGGILTMRVASERPTGAEDLNSAGIGYGGSPPGQGWVDSNLTAGYGMHLGGPTQNLNIAGQCHYSDPDGVVRRAMGGWVSSPTPAATTALPMATLASQSSRPLFLHRPYRSVAELGYVFSGTPWKNIDFFTPESGYSALLDAFCINEDYRADAISAGQVDLNGRQAPVFQALLNGAYRDELSAATATGAGTSIAALANSEAVTLSQDLVSRTLNTTVSGEGPLLNIADLTGRWISGSSTAAPVDPSSYNGFSGDLGIYTGGATSANNLVQRFRETSMRALSDSGQAGTWNLLIDIVAQSGRCPANAKSLANFLVEGERHYWVHVAIDRSTGQVIDENIETVNE
jgi:hypothetical protein